jgi:hypothetical protein
MEESQRAEDENKEGVVRWALGGFGKSSKIKR